MCVYVRACMCVHAHVFGCMCVCGGMSVRGLSASVSMCLCGCLYVCISVCLCVCEGCVLGDVWRGCLYLSV